MKKGMLAIAIALTTVAGYAQKTSLGINAGFGHAWLKNFPGDHQYKSAGNVGLSFIYSSESRFGFGADVKYSIEGGETEFAPIANAVTKREASLDYIRVPLKAMYFFGTPGNRFRPKITVGPSFGFLVGGEVNEKTTFGGATVVVPEQDAKDSFEGFDLGVNASVGIHYRLVKNTWFMADVNYYNGLKDVSNGDAFNYKNRNIGLNIGVNWGIGNN